MADSAPPTLPDPATSIEVTPGQVASWIGNAPGTRPLVLDCREEDERQICRLEGSEWIPLGEFPQRLEAIRDQSAHGVVIYCHHGIRSLRGASFLRSHGIAQAFSMAGGIDFWSTHIDPETPRY